jgi:hypothetical protein
VRRIPATVLLAAIGLAGCASSNSSPAPLGRSLTAQPTPVTAAPASPGDPPAESHGTVPLGHLTQTAAGISAPTPQAAIRSYALTYINWRASDLPARENQLASMAVGAARFEAQQTTASQSTLATLTANHVQNSGAVLAIAPGQGPAHGFWVVVTQETTTGLGAYAGLPTAPHVTLARAVSIDRLWVISAWRPQS